MKKNSKYEEELEEEDIIDFRIFLNRDTVLLGNKDYSKFKKLHNKQIKCNQKFYS